MVTDLDLGVTIDRDRFTVPKDPADRDLFDNGNLRNSSPANLELRTTTSYKRESPVIRSSVDGDSMIARIMPTVVAKVVKNSTPALDRRLSISAMLVGSLFWMRVKTRSTPYSLAAKAKE